MSTYTCATLFLQKHTDLVRQHPALLHQPHFIEPNNATWSSLLLPEALGIHPEYHISLYQVLSLTAPLLRFTEEEDYGWAYQVYYAGQLIAECYEDYVIFSGLMGQFWENPNYFPDLSQAARDKHYESEEELEMVLYHTHACQEAIAQQYRNNHAEAFQYFGVDAQTIQAIDALLQHPVLHLSSGLTWEERHEGPPKSFLEYQQLLSQKDSLTPLDHILRLVGVNTALLWRYEDVLQWRQEGFNYNPMGDTL